MPEQTHLKPNSQMPKSTPKSLKAPTFIRSIRSTFALRRLLGCSPASSSATAIRMSAKWRPRTQSNTTTTTTTNNNNNSKSRNSKKNANFTLSKQRKVVVVPTRGGRRHRQQQFVDLESPPATPYSPQTRNKRFSDRGPFVAKDTHNTYAENPARSNKATSPLVTTVALDFESVFRIPHSGADTSRTSHLLRDPHPSPEEITMILMRQPNILMGRSDSHDQFRDWRLDTDDMTYEQLLALGDKIGYVSTGLKESEVPRCVKKIKFLGKTLLQIIEEPERKCSICQEEYKPKDKLGLLKCTHSYHCDCIKQWLRHKKICPVCKSEVEAWH